MIEELLSIAESEGLTGKEAFRERAIHWFIDLDLDGNLIGFTPTTASSISKGKLLTRTRGKRFQTPANYHTQVKDGKIKSVCTNQHNWLPDFLSGPAKELFAEGIGGAQPNAAKQRECLCLIFEAQQQLPTNVRLKAISNYLRGATKFPEWLLPSANKEERETLLKRFADGEETISFRVSGKIGFQDDEIRQWWIERIRSSRKEVLSLLTEGRDFYLPDLGKLAEYFPSVFGNIPFASFDKQPFESYGLRKQTTPFRIETAERAAAALNWLLDKENGCRIGMSDLNAIFWTQTVGKIQATGFGEMMATADPFQVRDFLTGIWAGRLREIDQADFYAALLSTSPGRFAVRSWHADTLPRAEEQLREYFRATSLPRFGNPEATPFALSALANSTVQQSRESQPAPTTYSALFEAGLFGIRLPHKLLTATLTRQRVELAEGAAKRKPNKFDDRLAARTAIIRLYFCQRMKGECMSQEQHEAENHPAYLCGRLLALLDKIHIEAHRDSGGTNVSPANRVYGSASTTPALIFPQLLKLARYHLNKIGGGWAHYLEHGIPKERRNDGADKDHEGLAAVCARLTQFPRVLSLDEQGRFAIGFYYERCRQWPSTRKI